MEALYGRDGHVGAWLSGQRLLDLRGGHLGWIVDGSLFDSTGKHRGWLSDGWLRDANGAAVAFTDSATGSGPMKPMLAFKPFEPLESFEPFRPMFQITPFRPSWSLGWSPYSVGQLFSD